jgi:hypothetical protein
MMKRLGTLLCLGAAMLALPLRLTAQARDAALLAADRAMSELSSNSGLAPALAESLEPGGVLLWPGASVVVGPAQAERLLGMIPAEDSIRLTWQPLGIILARDSLLGVSWGIAVVTSRHTPTPPQLGRYIAAWHHQRDRWTLEAIMFNGVKPAATALPDGAPLTRSPAPATGAVAPFVNADLAFARLAGDSGAAVAFRHWAAPEAMIFGGHGLLTRGPDAIGRGVDGPASWRWHPVSAGAATSGDLGWTVGEAVIAPKEGEPVYSKYLTVWLRRSNGAVRFLTDGGNARPASP